MIFLKRYFFFAKQTYFGLIAAVLTNLSLSRVTNCMHVSDYIAGFGNHNYGCTLDFSSTHSTLLAWSSVLKGRKEGIQVWRKSHEFRNVFLNYSARIKTSRGIQALTNLLYDEIYGDCVQSLHIIDCHNRATIIAQNRHVKEYENIAQSYAPVVFNGSAYSKFLTHCNETFESNIKKC